MVVASPLCGEVVTCSSWNYRDTFSLAKNRRGEIKNGTGLSMPYSITPVLKLDMVETRDFERMQRRLGSIYGRMLEQERNTFTVVCAPAGLGELFDG